MLIFPSVHIPYIPDTRRKKAVSQPGFPWEELSPSAQPEAFLTCNKLTSLHLDGLSYVLFLGENGQATDLWVLLLSHRHAVLAEGGA